MVLRRFPMKRMLLLVTLVAFLLLVLGGNVWAAPIPSQTTCSATETPSAATVAAERELVKGQLVAYGLTQDEAAARMALLTDAEVHAVAADLDSVRAGGDLRYDTVTILAVIIVLLILFD